jgi:NAD(P) transhydrogenase subunit alpha
VNPELIASLTIFALAAFLGIELISRVPTLLHTAMLIAGSADSTLEQVLAFVALVFGTVNVVGGFLVTDRMLDMFKRKPEKGAE